MDTKSLIVFMYLFWYVFLPLFTSIILAFRYSYPPQERQNIKKTTYFKVSVGWFFGLIIALFPLVKVFVFAQEMFKVLSNIAYGYIMTPFSIYSISTLTIFVPLYFLCFGKSCLETIFIKIKNINKIKIFKIVLFVFISVFIMEVVYRLTIFTIIMPLSLFFIYKIELDKLANKKNANIGKRLLLLSILFAISIIVVKVSGLYVYMQEILPVKLGFLYDSTSLPMTLENHEFFLLVLYIVIFFFLKFFFKIYRKE